MDAAPVTWSEIAGRLAPARDYWLGTVRPDGSPHVTPVWGVVVGSDWYLYSERSTVKARNITAEPRVTLNLGDGEDVLIVSGSLLDVGRPASHGSILQAFQAKYTRASDLPFLPTVDPGFDVLYVLRPATALLWRLSDWEGSHRRWRQDTPVGEQMRLPG